MLTTSAEMAHNLFEQTVSPGIWQRLQRLFGGSQPDLLSMPGAEYEPQHTSLESRVPLEQIKGSFNPGRTRDFDGAFRPRHRRVADRWISIAQRFLEGGSLPPVKLVRVDDAYYVVDGHHRISVARALGYSDIAALIV